MIHPPSTIHHPSSIIHYHPLSSLCCFKLPNLRSVFLLSESLEQMQSGKKTYIYISPYHLLSVEAVNHRVCFDDHQQLPIHITAHRSSVPRKDWLYQLYLSFFSKKKLQIDLPCFFLRKHRPLTRFLRICSKKSEKKTNRGSMATHSFS